MILLLRLFLSFFFFISNQAFFNQIWNLNSQPGSKAEGHSMAYTKLRHIAAPQRLKMIRQADLAAAIHFRRFSVQLGQRYFRRCGRIRDWYVKLDVELVFEHLVVEPTLAEPPGALLIGLEPEPVVVRLLVVAHILDQGLIFFLQSCRFFILVHI